MRVYFFIVPLISLSLSLSNLLSRISSVLSSPLLFCSIPLLLSSKHAPPRFGSAGKEAMSFFYLVKAPACIVLTQPASIF